MSDSNRLRTSLIAVAATVTAAATFYAYRSYSKLHSPKADVALEPSLEDTFPSSEKNEILAEAAKSRGNKFFNEKNFEEAIAAYSEALGFYPVDHHARCISYANRAACHLILEDFDSTIIDCTQALSIDPHYLKALDRRSRALERTGHLKDALIDSTAACLIDDFKTESITRRVDDLLNSASSKNLTNFSKPSNVESMPSDFVIREFISSFPFEFDKLSNELPIGDSGIDRFTSLLRDSQWEKAQTLSDDIFASISGNESLSLDQKSFLLHWCANMDFLKGNLTNASSKLKDALFYNPQDYLALIKLAMISAELNDFQEAVAYLEKSEIFALNCPSFFYYRGELLAMTGNVHMALNDFTHALEIRPDFVCAITRKARCLLALNQISESVAFLQQQLKLLPSSLEIQHCLAETLVLQGKNSEACELLEKMELQDSAYVQVYFTRALMALKRDVPDHDEAEKLLRKSISLDSSFQEAYLQLAGLLAASGQELEAECLFKEAACQCRTDQQRLSVFSLQIASLVQAEVCQRYPELKDKIR